MEKIIKYYNNIFGVLFLTFLAGILSFGRALAIARINIGWQQLFITEIILLAGLPFIFSNFKAILRMPRRFSFALAAYFLLGLTHLLTGIASKNFFALRDSVLFAYVLFFYISYLFFSARKIGKAALILLFISNLIAILIGQLYISGLQTLPEKLARFLMTARITNLCLYYGLCLAFLISCLLFSRNKKLKILALITGILNLYALMFLASRSAWVSCVLMGAYFILMLKIKFLRIFIPFLLIFFLIGAIFYYFSFESGESLPKNAFFSKLQSTALFLKNQNHSLDDSDYLEVIQGPFDHYEETTEGVKNRHLSKGDSEEYDNLTFRVLIWQAAIDFGKKSPLWGRGFGVYPRYLNWDRTPMQEPKKTFLNSNIIPTHNHLISLFYKMGLAGLGLFVFINIGVFFYGLKYLKSCNLLVNQIILKGALGGIIFWHSMALFFDIIDSPPTSIFIWILLGVVFACVALDKKSEAFINLKP